MILGVRNWLCITSGACNATMARIAPLGVPNPNLKLTVVLLGALIFFKASSTSNGAQSTVLGLETPPGVRTAPFGALNTAACFLQCLLGAALACIITYNRRNAIKVAITDLFFCGHKKIYIKNGIIFL